MRTDHFRKYEGLFRLEKDPKEVYRAAQADGLDGIACIRLLRQVCGLSLIGAKRVIVTADERAASLEAYQEQLTPGVKQALQELETKGAEENDVP